MFKHIPNPFIPTISDGVVVETGEFTTIHVSGQVGHETVLKVTAASFEEEARLCFANVAKVLERAGAGMKDVVRITCYLTDLADYAAYSKARGVAFPVNPPASATVQVAGLLANARLEIDAVAVIKTKR
ncbi:MAG TPA: RidA family protein [Dongiaceae bacterium]|jgi:2-iminobutanoate/2-iminopropanoate deaminase